MPLTFKSEEERMQHPQAKLIPLNIWKILDSTLSEDQLMFMMIPTTEERLEIAKDYKDLLQTYRSLLCFGLAHPEVDDTSLVNMAIDKLEFNADDVLKVGVILGRPKIVGLALTQMALDDTNVRYPTASIFKASAQIGNINVLKEILQDNSSLIKILKENPKIFLETAAVAASYGHYEFLRYMDELYPTKITKFSEMFHRDFDVIDQSVRHGHINILAWLQSKAPNEFQNELYKRLSTTDALHEHIEEDGALETLKWIHSLNPEKFQEIITLNDFKIFSTALIANKGEIFDWLKSLIPNKTKELAQSDAGVDICRFAVSQHNTTLLNWLRAQYPDVNGYLLMINGLATAVETSDPAMIRLVYQIHLEHNKTPPVYFSDGITFSRNQALEAASKKGIVAILKLLKEIMPAHFSMMLADNQYKVLEVAASNGKLEALQWLINELPDNHDNKIKAGIQNAFGEAVSTGSFAVMNWLKSQGYELSDENRSRLYRRAANLDRLDIMKWIKEEAPRNFNFDEKNLFTSVATRGNFEPSHANNAIQKYLLQNPSVLDYAEAHQREHGSVVNETIVIELHALRTQRQQFEMEHPNEVFNLTDPDQICRYYVIARNCVRLNTQASNDDLRFLLSIPAVKAVAVRSPLSLRSNELLRLAMSAQNNDASQILLTIPAVRQLAERENFYRNESRGQLNLAQLARDNESSMTALTTGEQRRLEQAINLYQPMIKQAGANNIVEGLRDTLRERYEANPAVINVKGETIKLPLLWKDFNALNLNAADRQQALQAYYKNADHTALRYLSKPNDWMHENASYVYVNPDNRNEKWSTFDEYIPLISMLWLGAGDTKVPPTDDLTIDARINHFIAELGYIGRSHNWDRTRDKRKADGSLARNEYGNVIKEEYDDLEADRPSCFSGVKRRLFQSVIGHPLLDVLTESKINTELFKYALQHFRNNFNEEYKNAFTSAVSCMIDYDPIPLDTYKLLQKLDIDPKEFVKALTEKYGEQVLEFVNYINSRLQLPDNNDDEKMRHSHIMRFMPPDGPDKYLKAIMEPEPTPKVSKQGVFAGERAGDIAKDPGNSPDKQRRPQ